jgi:hypothetical protein
MRLRPITPVAPATNILISFLTGSQVAGWSSTAALAAAQPEESGLSALPLNTGTIMVWQK